MGENSKIEWCHHTFNPWLGCTKVSPACANCYAEAWAKRTGIVKWGASAERRKTTESYWRQPLKWNAEAMRSGERRRVFCASLADVFEDRPELEPWRRELYSIIYRTPYLDWLLLTKRPENIVRLSSRCVNKTSLGWKLPANIWLGTTVESDEQRRRIEHLLNCGEICSTLFLSCEPLLGPLNLNAYLNTKFMDSGCYSNPHRIDWVIVGGESGGSARPSNPQWFRSLRDQCVAAGVAFHFKQWGEWAPTANVGFGDSPRAATHTFKTGQMIDTYGGPVPFGIEVRRIGKKAAGRLLDGVEWNQFPAGHLRGECK